MSHAEVLITVIVPVYNVEEYLRKCLDSVIGQTHRNLQIILVDDGSTDSGGAICDEYEKKDPRIAVIHQENMGPAMARNNGLAIAKGEYVAFVDSDDWIAPNMYEVMLDSIIRNDCDVATCGRYSVRGDEIKESGMFHLDQEAVMEGKEAVKRLLTYDGIDMAFWDKLYKREILEGIVLPSGYVSEDVVPAYRILKKSKRVVHCGKPLYYWLHRQGSLSRSGFSPKSMGLYYYFKEVYEDCLVSFPDLKKEAEFFYVKNLLVLACRIADDDSKVPERKMVNSVVRKNWKAILSGSILPTRYKLFAISIFLRSERFAVRFLRLLGIRVI